MKKTAMQQLIEWIKETPPQTRHAVLYDKCKRLLETEKKNIVDAFEEGGHNCDLAHDENNTPYIEYYKSAEEYYTQTFKQ